MGGGVNAATLVGRATTSQFEDIIRSEIDAISGPFAFLPQETMDAALI